ncbi:hypothetical protein EXIGLDRAFT_833591 [Exidia glandulosa HHB12029]|uniref:Nudix hydrolase domain-containing protein n=1 Tax=Exidia glandulosa HHB12029 TaxID=1314781 RepID=A0A165KKU7_EXIGL|nr:hypothetical protein EXIGLDRAFT_833591 [Exidia glandulosa HHB12029]
MSFNEQTARGTGNSQQHPSSLPTLSDRSTPALPTSLWSSEDFMLGAGAIIIQPSTDKVCILEDAVRYPGSYFLPRGRKDVGESLEQTVLREAHEESGYRVEFLPAAHPVLQPRSQQDMLTSEAFHISLTPFHHRRRGPLPNTGGEYLVFWFLCQIAEDAEPEQGTRMPDEQGYVTHLLSIDDALAKMARSGDTLEYHVLRRGVEIYLDTTILLNEARAP